MHNTSPHHRFGDPLQPTRGAVAPCAMSGSQVQFKRCNQDGGFRGQGSSAASNPRSALIDVLSSPSSRKGEKQTSAIRRCGQSGAVAIRVSGLHTRPPQASDAPQSPDASRQSRRKIELLCAWSLQLLIPIKTNLPVRLTPDRAQRNLSTTASPINPLFLHHR